MQEAAAGPESNEILNPNLEPETHPEAVVPTTKPTTEVINIIYPIR
jgi:hypothetical protein